MSLIITKIIIKRIKLRWKKEISIGNQMNLKRKIPLMLKNKLYLKHNNGNLKEVDLILLSEKMDPRADNLFEEIFKNQFSQSAKYKMMKIIRKKNKKYNKKNRQKNKNNINKK